MGYLQFIIFGLKTREKDYGGAYPGHCARCDNEAYMHAFKWRRWFHVFWIPLVPWFANRALVCPICGQTLELDRAGFKRARGLAAQARQLEKGEVSEDAFLKSIHEFEIETGFQDATDELADSAPTEGDDAVDPPKQ